MIYPKHHTEEYWTQLNNWPEVEYRHSEECESEGTEDQFNTLLQSVELRLMERIAKGEYMLVVIDTATEELTCTYKDVTNNTENPTPTHRQLNRIL